MNPAALNPTCVLFSTMQIWKARSAFISLVIMAELTWHQKAACSLMEGGHEMATVLMYELN